MQYISILQNLKNQQILSEIEAKKILNFEQKPPFSIHWELRIILYLGITSLCAGLGILIYQNIDTIGHDILIALIAILCLAAFGFAFVKQPPFSTEEVKQTSKFSDFALLIGCLLFLSLEGYLQFQYQIFDNKAGLATILPAIVFLFCAYYFDHRGVLAMGITAVASWVGVSIAPLEVFKNNFSDKNLLVSAIVLGVVLIIVGYVSERFSFKKHFTFNYFLLGGNLATIAVLSGLFNSDAKFIYLSITCILCFLSIIYALKTQSYLFLLLGSLYGYVAFSYAFFHYLPDSFTGIFAIYYFFGTGVGMIVFFTKIKDIFK